MPAAASPLLAQLQRLGFRKWYERQLLGSHAHLVLCVFCLLGVVGGFEAYASAAQTVAERLLDLGAVLLFSGLGVWAIREYGRRMALAEFIANQASCPQCGRYARWRCLHADDDGIAVSCKDCQHGWRIET